ncbi:MAG TPA: TonB-dependent receptor, partial [Acidisarcina sp.]
SGMSISLRPRRHRLILLCAFTIALFAARVPLNAVLVHGVVADPLGRPVANATVALVQNGSTVANALTGPDGSYQLSSGAAGRYFVLVAGQSFRQVVTDGFYGAPLGSVERNVVLEPEWVRQQIVVTATGTPVPQAQVSGSVSVLPENEFRNRALMADALRQIPGVIVVQQGQRGSLSSVFVRGGNSNSNKVLLDGVPMEDVGGVFDLGTISSTGIASVEAYRGPDSVLYGSDAAAGVFSFTTPHGTTPFPSLFYEGDVGNYHTYRNEVQLGGARRSIDYYGAFSRLNSANALPMDEMHNVTSSANLGWSFSPATQVRVTARNANAATSLPGAFDFYGISNDGTQKDQDVFLSGTIDNQTTERWHNMVRYGLGRKREQQSQAFPVGQLVFNYDQNGKSDGGNYFGNAVTIRGANGYSVQGQAFIDSGPAFFGTYPNSSDSASNRDQLQFQSYYRVTPHLSGLFGFRYEDERGTYKFPTFFIDDSLERTNYDYTVQVQGDIKSRLFYSAGGGIEKNQIFGTEATPHFGLNYYLVRPGRGVLHGTQVKFNFSKGVREPGIFDQFDSLYGILHQAGDDAIASQYNVHPIGAERSRSYDGGIEQSFASERLLLRAIYFHNEFGNQIEFVNAGVLTQLGVNATVAATINNLFGGADIGSLSFRAQGAETEAQFGFGHNIFIRSGYTYLDAVVQHSFSSSAVNPTFNIGLPGTAAPSFSTIAIGASSPLRGARPFRRAPHTGFVTATYSGVKWAGAVTSAFSSRSDDSTFLGGSDVIYGNSLLLPNHNLDYGFTKLDASVSYQVQPWVNLYTQVDNILNNQHIGPIGYPALPLNYRVGMRFTVGHTKAQ